MKFRPQHYRLGGADGTMTACGLRGIQHRPLKYTDDKARVSCFLCLRWFDKYGKRP